MTTRRGEIDDWDRSATHFFIDLLSLFLETKYRKTAILFTAQLIRLLIPM
jgi:hypothetical protein